MFSTTDSSVCHPTKKLVSHTPTIYIYIYSYYATYPKLSFVSVKIILSELRVFAFITSFNFLYINININKIVFYTPLTWHCPMYDTEHAESVVHILEHYFLPLDLCYSVCHSL